MQSIYALKELNNENKGKLLKSILSCLQTPNKYDGIKKVMNIFGRASEMNYHRDILYIDELIEEFRLIDLPYYKLRYIIESIDRFYDIKEIEFRSINTLRTHFKNNNRLAGMIGINIFLCIVDNETLVTMFTDPLFKYEVARISDILELDPDDSNPKLTQSKVYTELYNIYVAQYLKFGI